LCGRETQVEDRREAAGVNGGEAKRRELVS